MTKARIGLALAAVAVAAVFAGCTDKTTGSTQTLTFTEVGKGSEFHPIGPNVPEDGTAPPGSGFALSVPLQDSSKETVGTLNAACISTKPAAQNIYGTCSGMADVPDGQLALSVGGDIGDNVTGAIVGGTGKYEGATGTFTSKGSGGGSQDTFTVTLP